MTLHDLQTPNGKFAIAPFDQRGSLAKLLGVDHTSESGKKEIKDLKISFMKVFSPIASGVLVDPEFGLPALEYRDHHAGLLLSLEKSSYDAEDKNAMPQFYEGWGVSQIIEKGGMVKLLMFYHPQSSNADKKRALAKKFFEESKAAGSPFLLEVILHPNGESEQEFIQTFTKLQTQLVKDFTDVCDVLKLEFPIHAGAELNEDEAAKACDQISAASKVPWILLSKGMGFERFIRAVEIAMKHGSSGFAVGRAIWKEVGDYPTIERENFLHNVAVPRLQQLIALL